MSYHTTSTTSNVVFADGHAEGVRNNQMPHANAPTENNGSFSFLIAQ